MTHAEKEALRLICAVALIAVNGALCLAIMSCGAEPGDFSPGRTHGCWYRVASEEVCEYPADSQAVCVLCYVCRPCRPENFAEDHCLADGRWVECVAFCGCDDVLGNNGSASELSEED
jgi:hypothetical protein